MFGLLKRLRSASASTDGVPGRLSGIFDIRDGMLVGYVEKIHGMSHTGTTIEVWRQHVRIASVPVSADTGHGKMPFKLAIEGRFTVAELVVETVRLNARNARGDTGPITLDGATQLELIRDHLGIPVEPIIDLDFTRDGNARPYLGAGWSGAENNFTWTEGDDSLVHFPTPRTAGPYLLRLRTAAFLSVMITAQKLDIYVNEELIAATMIDGQLAEFREFRFDGSLFGTEATTTLRLHHPFAGRPSEHHGTGDARRLAFSFRRLSIVRPLNTED